MKGFVLSLVFLTAYSLRPTAAFADYASGMNHYRRAWAAYATQDFGKAKRWAEAAAKADPENAHAFSLIGELAYLRHDLEGAKEAWERALGLAPHLAPLKGQIAQAQMELGMEGRLVAIRHWPKAQGQPPIASGSLVVRVPKDLPAEEEQAIVAALAGAMEGLEPHFQYRVNRPLTVLIYPRDAFYGQMHVPTEVLGLFDGKIRIPADPSLRATEGSEAISLREGIASSAPEPVPSGSEGGPPRNDRGERVLWHEYAHAVVYDLSHGRAPRWLQEGLAQECEGLVPRGSRSSRQGIASGPAGPRNDEGGELPALRALLGIAERPGEEVVMPAGQFYAASHSLVRYLLETRGWDRMRVFLKALGAGRSVEEALERVYGWEVDALEKRLGAW